MLLELLTLATLARAEVPEPPPAGAGEVQVVVTYDNGEFNLPLYTPRWTGRWSQPAVAQEITTGIARMAGRNPQVYTYLPPGRTPGRPGVPWRVEPRLAGCEGPAAEPSDPCWCGPADRCWADLGPNYHPDSSTSLYLTAASVRETLRGAGPRVEIHFTDLFEEDPSAAEDSAHSDRCVTRAGTRKALEGLLRTPAGESLDHLAVGLLEVEVEPPPPGSGSWGWTYAFQQVADSACWSASRSGPWQSGRSPYRMAMGVLALGLDTASVDEEVDALLQGLTAQLSGEGMSLSLLRLRDPLTRHTVEGSVLLDELGNLAIRAPARPSQVPCADVQRVIELDAEGRMITPAGAAADCTGSAMLAIPPRQIQRVFLRRAGLDPRVETLELTGRIQLAGDPAPIREAFDALARQNDAVKDRSLPLWEALEQALDLSSSRSGARPWEVWRHEVEIRALTVTGADTRPWLAVLLGALASALAGGVGAYLVIERIDAAQAFQSHWDRNVGPGEDPLRQRPLAAVLAEAQEQVRSRWGKRVGVAVGIAVIAAVAAAWILLRLHVVRLG